jgi:chromosome segregation ATPase
MTDNRKYRNIRNIDKRINNLQEQYKNQFSFINDLGKKIETLDSSLDNLKSNIKENYDSLKTLPEITINIQKTILELITLYTQLKENSRILKKQIKDLESKKSNINKKAKEIRKELKSLTTKIIERDGHIKLQFNKINNRNNYYKQIIKLLRSYDKQVNKLIPEDYEYLKTEIISKLEYMVENIQYIKKTLYTKSKRLERIDNNFNNIRDLLKKYSSANKEIPNIIDDIRKSEGVRKDVFLKDIIKN